MFGITKKKIRKLNVAWHRDLGYMLSSLIIVYCISGLALNHVDDWNPDFIIHKKTITLSKSYSRNTINDRHIAELGVLVGESDYKIYDFPTKDQLKIYYEDATFHVNFSKGKGAYEKVSKRPLFYQTNVIHRNSLKGWRWASDIFAVLLITITISGLFIMKGKKGIGGRGKWFIAAGFLPIVIALIIQAFK